MLYENSFVHQIPRMSCDDLVSALPSQRNLKHYCCEESGFSESQSRDACLSIYWHILVHSRNLLCKRPTRKWHDWLHLQPIENISVWQLTVRTQQWKTPDSFIEINQCLSSVSSWILYFNTHDPHWRLTARDGSSFIMACRSLSDKNLSGPKSTWNQG